MIVKYLSCDVWGYIDNVRQAACKNLDCESAIRQYDETMRTAENDPAEFAESGRLDENIIKSNKAFVMAGIHMADEGINRHAENLIDPERMDYPVVAILVYLEECKEYDAILLVTNQKAFLMNDKGQTIERLN